MITATIAAINLAVGAATVTFGVTVMVAALFVAGAVEGSAVWPNVAGAAGLRGRAGGT